MEFTLLDAAVATEDDIRAVYAIEVACILADRPGSEPPSLESSAAYLKSATSGAMPNHCWVAREGGCVVAYSWFQTPRHENEDNVFIQVQVPPERRRQGIGTQLFRALLKVARAQEREIVIGPNILSGSDSEQWALAQGLEPVWRYVIQQLTVADADPALWDVADSAGYRMAGWTGAAPESLVDSYATARTAIQDAPVGTMAWEETAWTAERVRRHEKDLVAANIEAWVTAAVHEESGTVSGFTELAIRPSRPEQAFQFDTAVLREHRGHGLGRCMKAATMRRLVAERPDLERVQTQTAVDNEHMIRTNHALGYVTLRTMVNVQADLAELERRHGIG